MFSLRAIEKIPDDVLPCAIGVFATDHVLPASGEWNTRAAGPPVTKYICGPQTSKQVPLPAKAPSLGSAAGMLSGGNSIHRSPSAVASTTNLTSTGSLNAKQSLGPQQASASRKNAARLSAYCRVQVAPPSVVL